jgi:spore germination protein GerM
MQRTAISVIIGISIAVLLTGGGVAWWALNSITSSDQTTTESQPSPSPSPSPSEVAQEEQIQIYWLNSTGEEIKFLPSGVTIEKSLTPSEALESAFKRLLVGPKDANFVTSIPTDTQLLSLKVEADGVHVDLSEEFTFGGGTTSMITRLGQIIYTASSLDPNTNVWIDIKGEPLEILGGEGIMVDQPMTRQMFEDNFQL